MPVLVTPANNDSTATTVTLTWNPISQWGTACTGANNQITVYVGTTNPPTTVYTPTTPTTYDFTSTNGTTYYWYVRAHNGQLGTNSTIWSFNMAAVCDNLAPTNVVVTGIL